MKYFLKIVTVNMRYSLKIVTATRYNLFLKQKRFCRFPNEQVFNVNKYEITLRDLLLVDIETVYQ